MLTSGTRVVVVTIVSLVSVGAVIGVGGLGQLFTSGYQRNYPDQVFAGIITILALAFVLDRLIAVTGRALTPWVAASHPTTARSLRRRNKLRTSTLGQTASAEGGDSHA